MDILSLFKENADINFVANAGEDDIGVDFSFFSKDEASKLDGGPQDTNLPEKKKRNRTTKVVEAGSNEPMANPIPGAAVAETNYAQSYNEANNLLLGAIVQTDEAISDIKKDLIDIGNSKTLKNKYTYKTNLTSTYGSLLGIKVQAIKELNTVTTQIHNLELNRFKTLKIDQKDANDDMKMMDIYSAFVNAPIGSYAPPRPSIQDISIGVNSQNSNISAVEMVAANSNQDPLTPEQNRMRMESNPNIQIVVRYNQSTGQRCFDVVDRSTGLSIPNYPRPDSFLLDDTTIDVHAGIARNRNVDSVWPLIIEGSNSMPITEY